jgi:hypothetical protein
MVYITSVDGGKNKFKVIIADCRTRRALISKICAENGFRFWDHIPDDISKTITNLSSMNLQYILNRQPTALEM